MSYERARQLLAQASSFANRQQAIRTAIDLGMPLGEIQDYLDWLEQGLAASKDLSRVTFAWQCDRRRALPARLLAK